MDTDGIVQKKEWVGKLSIPFFVKKKTPGPKKCKKNTLKKNKKSFKKTVDKCQSPWYNKYRKEVNTMVEIIDFVLKNAESIESYEVIDYSMDATIVEFTMVNGEKKVLMF